jgi:YHS domain-containing protein
MNRNKMLALSALILFVGILALSVSLQAAEKVTCPVSGKEIEKSEAAGSMEYKGKTYYFCCENCQKSFTENPEKYLNAKPGELHEHGEGHEHMEHGEGHEENGKVKDAVCGMEIDKDKAAATYEYKGKTYYFCMEKCKEEFAKNPAKYISADDSSVACPVSGETFNKSENTESMDYNGKTYYFCCAGCKEKFEENPEKYAKKK